MTNTPANVRVPATGLVMVGPTTAAAPTSAVSVATGFEDLGLIDEKGLAVKPTRTTKDIRAFQYNAVARTVPTEAKVVYEFTLIETSKATIEFAYGTTVTQTITEGTYTADPSATGGRKSFIIGTTDGENIRREYVADGELTEMTPSAFVNAEPVAYTCVVTAYSIPAVFDTALKT